MFILQLNKIIHHPSSVKQQASYYSINTTKPEPASTLPFPSAFNMDEKQSLGSSHSSFHPSTDADVEQVRPRWHASYIPYRDRTLRRICIVAILIVLAFWKFRQLLLYYPMLHGGTDHQRMSGNHLSHLSNGGNKTHNVSLEAHIMSKCPDAKACLQELVVPAMEKFHDKVDFELSFIGR